MRATLYYWAPCPTCSVAVHYAQEHGIELDLKDVEEVGPCDELIALGGDPNNIPYYYDGYQLIEGQEAVMEQLKKIYDSREHEKLYAEGLKRHLF